MKNKESKKFFELESNGGKNIQKFCKNRLKETSEELRESFSSLSKANVKLKPLGFWSKKLKDLEETFENRKSGLYEFNSTDELEISQKRKKKPKKATQKKKHSEIPKQRKLREKVNEMSKVEKSNKLIHMNSLFREQIILSKERKKLADKGKKFTFCAGMSSLGITSTPTLNKDNLVGASNFLFLSPIIKEKFESYNNVEGVVVKPIIEDHEPPTMYLYQETPMIETKLKRIGCRRVLRSGKMLKM